MYRNGFFIFFLSGLLLTGCQKKSYDITFKKKMVIDYNSKASPLECIESIGKEKNIKKYISKDGKQLKFDNFIVKWSGDFSSSKKGVYTVTFTTNMAEQIPLDKSIYVEDISAPVIMLKQKEVDLTLDQLKNLNPADYYTVRDNSDEEVSVKAEYETNPSQSGDYTMNISAVDTAGNISGKSLLMHIRIDQELEKQDSNTDGKKHESSASSNKKTETTKTNNNKPTSKPNSSARKESEREPQPQRRKATASSKYFAFTESSNMNQTYHRAMDYAKSQIRAGNARGYDVTPVQGSDGIYTGYKVTFY